MTIANVDHSITESTLVELGRLHWNRPSVDAPETEIAAWYEQKAALHEHLVRECDDVTTRAMNADTLPKLDATLNPFVPRTRLVENPTTSPD